MGFHALRHRRTVGALALLLGIGSCGSAPPPRIIVFIADGAGVAHWTLAVLAKSDLAIREFRTVGLVDTRGADHTVTGSAAGATALATGARTFFGAVGVTPDSAPAQTVLELAAARGMSTGLVTTTWLVDATPAAFASHVPQRAALGDIALQMGTLGVTVLMGGGRRAFLPEVRPDSLDLLGQLRERYTYVDSDERLQALNIDTVTALLGLFAEADMGVVGERSPSLSQMTAAALSVVGDDPDGFFLMIENEESDTQAHRNEPREVIVSEMLDLDRAIRLGLDYQATHPETLILVLSDHETGGMTLTPDADRNVVLAYTTGDHTASFIPLFAKGPGAERFGGLLTNEQVGQLLQEVVRAP